MVEDYKRVAGKQIVAMPKPDEDLLRDVVFGLVADKVRFYESARELFPDPPETVLTYGALEELKIQGDTATGRSERTHRTKGAASGHQQVMLLHFRQVNGGWHIERLECQAPR